MATSRRDATTSTILTSGDTALLVDPAWEPDELDALAWWLADRRLTVAAGFATHAHHDHLLWHPRFGTPPRYASAATTRRVRERRTMLVAELGDGWPAVLADLVGRVRPAVDSVWPGLEQIEHDAHVPGHTALWMPGPRVLVAGDMLSDAEIPLLEDSGYAAYRTGLDVLRPYAAAASLVIPGHGTPGADAADRWAADDHYLRELADGGRGDDPRLQNPGMAAAEAANRERIAR